MAIRSLFLVAIASGFAIVTQSHAETEKAGNAAAKNASEHTQVMTYQVYAGGINAVDAEMVVEYPDNGHYDIFFEAKTRGFLGKLAPWWGTFESNGWRVNGEGADRPKLHKSVSSWRDEKEIKEYFYNKDGTFEELKITEEGKDKSPKELEDELVQNTTDALTATLQVMQSIADGSPCQGSSEVFDGKRRFNLVFNDIGAATLERTRYNVYEGEAVKCTVEVDPITGDWHEKPRGWMSIQEQGRERGMLPTIWMGQISDHGPAVPVKVRVKTAYGTLFMHLIKYRNGDTKIALN